MCLLKLSHGWWVLKFIQRSPLCWVLMSPPATLKPMQAPKRSALRSLIKDNLNLGHCRDCQWKRRCNNLLCFCLLRKLSGWRPVARDGSDYPACPSCPLAQGPNITSRPGPSLSTLWPARDLYSCWLFWEFAPNPRCTNWGNLIALPVLRLGSRKSERAPSKKISSNASVCRQVTFHKKRATKRPASFHCLARIVNRTVEPWSTACTHNRKHHKQMKQQHWINRPVAAMPITSCHGCRDCRTHEPKAQTFFGFAGDFTCHLSRQFWLSRYVNSCILQL